MADTAAVPAPSTSGTGGRLKLLLVAVVVLVGAAVAAKTFLLSAPAADAEAPVAPVEGPVVTIGQMTTSLAGEGAHYVRVDLAAVTNADADPAGLEERFPLMRDQALDVLMGFSAEELRSVEGADRLRTALTARAQEVWEDDQVLRIVLTDLLVQ